MGLQAKFNLVMLVAFVIGLVLAGAMAYALSNGSARRDVLRQAALMTSQGNAVSAYTDQEVAPILAKSGATQFFPQTIPFWSAQNIFRRVQKDFPDYSYRDPALNPTNPTDRATPAEAEIIGQFRRNPGLHELVTTRNTPAGPVLSVSRPIRADASCLVCHSTPAAAPPAMVSLYGPNNGFGWKVGETVGAQIVSVPMRVPLQRAWRTFYIFLGGLVVVFLVMIGLLNLLLSLVIVKPVRRIAGMANEVSMGRMDVPEYKAAGKDEIASLAESFNRMRRSLANAMKLLGE